MLMAELAESSVTVFTPTVPGAGSDMLGTPMGKAVLHVLETTYTMRPMGSETANELRNRIARVYIDNAVPAGRYTTDMSKILADENFHATVRNVCPLCPIQPPTGLPSKSSTPVKPEDFITPKPGSVAVTGLSMNDILELLKAGLGTYTTLQQQQLAAELMKRQQQGQSIQIPPQLQNGWSTGAIVGVSMGALVIGGLLIYALASKKKGAPPVNTKALVKAR